jgi:hypothetical protein
LIDPATSVAFAERITAYRTPRILDVEGFFISCRWFMDTVEIKKNIEKYSTEISKYQSLSRAMMTRDEMIMIDQKIVKFRERISNLRVVLNARQ